MDKDKLIADAWEAGSNEYFPDDPRRDSFEDGFKQGAEWLMQQPLPDRLTEEEKEKLKAMYKREVDSMVLEMHRIKNAENEIEKICHESNFWQAKLKADMLEQIFGKELFNHPTEV